MNEADLFYYAGADGEIWVRYHFVLAFPPTLDVSTMKERPVKMQTVRSYLSLKRMFSYSSKEFSTLFNDDEPGKVLTDTEVARKWTRIRATINKWMHRRKSITAYTRNKPRLLRVFDFDEESSECESENAEEFQEEGTFQVALTDGTKHLMLTIEYCYVCWFR